MVPETPLENGGECERILRDKPLKSLEIIRIRYSIDRETERQRDRKRIIRKDSERSTTPAQGQASARTKRRMNETPAVR